MYTKTEYSDNQLLKMMQQAGLRPSLHRIAVLSFVANSRSHPSADEVYTRLSKQFPTMSRTTIYNALHALVETSLLRELEIESGTMRLWSYPQTWSRPLHMPKMRKNLRYWNAWRSHVISFTRLLHRLYRHLLQRAMPNVHNWTTLNNNNKTLPNKRRP